MQHATGIHSTVLKKRSDMTLRSKSETWMSKMALPHHLQVLQAQLHPFKIIIPEAKLVERLRYKTSGKQNSWAHSRSCVGLLLRRISKLLPVFCLLHWRSKTRINVY